ncbi:MAG: hypothetical protein Q4Q58_06610 [Thermoplasmata archaeon]|nr:hypothetical protein [Thermoplasmata archaeon]
MFARDAQNNIAAVERMKEIVGLRWTQSVEGGSEVLGAGTAEPIRVTVRSSGLGWEAYSVSPEIHCLGRSPSDALGFYRFCLSECRSS